MSPTNRDNANSLLEDIKSNWTIVVIIVGFIVGYTNLQNKVSQNEEAIRNLQQEQIELQKSATSFGNDITYIKTTLDYIKQNLTRY